MFFITKTELYKSEAIDRNESLGSKEYADYEKETVLIRVNVNHIEYYHPDFRSNDQAVIELVSGSLLVSLEPLEVIEEKIQRAGLIHLGN